MLGKCRGADGAPIDLDKKIASKQCGCPHCSFPTPTYPDHWAAFFKYASLLPPGVRSMTYGEFCQDVAEGLR